jgi:hypothetical protein
VPRQVTVAAASATCRPKPTVLFIFSNIQLSK